MGATSGGARLGVDGQTLLITLPGLATVIF